MRRGAAGLLAVLSLALLGLPGASASDAAGVAVRVEPGGLRAAGVDAAFRASYGTFDWAVVGGPDLARLRKAGVVVVPYPEAGTLVLPGGRLDPLVDDAPAGDRAGLHLVQLWGPSKDGWLDALRARGASLVQYLAPFSYVALLDPAEADAIRSLPFVRWVGPFTAAGRFADLDPAGEAVNAVLVGGNVAATVRSLAALGAAPEITGRSIPFMDVEGVGIHARGGPGVVSALASNPHVYSIAPQRKGELRDEMSDQISAGNFSAEGLPQTGYRDWLASHELSGEGVIVAHVDDGYGSGHPDNLGTIDGCHDYRLPDGDCDPNLGTGSDFHGQHTGGIIVGQGTELASDEDGFAYGLGMAPGAKLFVQNYIALEALFGYEGPGQYVSLNRDSVLGGAVISANSWGPSGRPRGYDADTREFDMAPRDANPETPEHEPLNFVLSIMNGSGGKSTQGTPDEGKNILRVGSTKNHRAGDIDDLSFSSAHGPALDGRLLPDVVAPGERVVSTANPATVALCLDPVVDAEAALYSHCTGTSMASPHVSGGSAVFTEHYRKELGSTPSPALVKGAFVNGAVDLAGSKDADGKVMGHIPDNNQGWGRFHLGNAIGGPEKDYLDQTVLLGSTGAAWQAVVEPIDPSAPVKITLVWTDAPGHGMGGDTPAWVNDLDLRVTDGSTSYLGNSFGNPSTGWSVPGGAPDRMNNIENVYLRSAPGPLALEVLAANLAGDGVPGNGDDTDQDFALVVSGGRLAG